MDKTQHCPGQQSQPGMSPCRSGPEKSQPCPGQQPQPGMSPGHPAGPGKPQTCPGKKKGAQFPGFSADDPCQNIDALQEWYLREHWRTMCPDSSVGTPNIGPVRTVEFPPLSMQPVGQGKTMPPCNPIDSMVIEKCTPVPPEQEESMEKKDLCMIVTDSESMIKTATAQVRHLNAITQELRLLLKYEQKILKQVVCRIEKFKGLRDENKRKATEWENEYKEKLPEYDSYSTKLINVPHTENISVEGVPGPVQQKILFQIVSRTTNTANRVVVQLSMEEAVANDIDLTLQDLKKHCAVMLKQINGWLKMLEAQVKHQNIVLDRLDECKTNLKEIKEKGEAEDERSKTVCGKNQDGKNKSKQMKPYEDRLKRIEEAICRLCGPACGTCPEQTDPYDARLKGIEEAICKLYYSQQCPPSPCYSPFQMCQTSYSDPRCDPTRGATNNCSPNNQQSVSPCPPDCTPVVCPPCPPSPQICSPPICPLPNLICYPSPSCPPCPQMGSPMNPFSCPPSPDFPNHCPTSPPVSPGWRSPSGGNSAECADQRVLHRGRSAPGMFPDFDLIDVPGMGFPIPKAALERGGRQRGEVPLSPTSPPPRQMGRFRPLASSSFIGGHGPGELRPWHSPTQMPPNPMDGQSMDPALLPKIQNDLQRLGERNRNLQDLVNNFKSIRATLTDAIDKAVKLNQKLQRDLYYAAEAHK